MATSPVTKLSSHPEPVNTTARLVVQPQNPDNMTQEQIAEERINTCKTMAYNMGKSFPDAPGKHTYLLNVAAKELGYKDFDHMRRMLDVSPKVADEATRPERTNLVRRNQMLQFRVLELEEEIRKLKGERS